MWWGHAGAMMCMLGLWWAGAQEAPLDSNVIMLPGEPQTMSVWTSAVQFRNGDRLYISNRTEMAVVNFNIYGFRTQNLYYWSEARRTTLFLTYIIPGHAPLGVFLHPSPRSLEGDSEWAWVSTATCLLKVWIKAPDFERAPHSSVEAGHCYEQRMRDGPKHFARFNRIQAVASACAPQGGCGTLVLDTGRRLCLMEGDTVVSVATLPADAKAIGLGWRGGGWAWTVAWAAGGLSNPNFARSVRFVALEVLNDEEGTLFALDVDGYTYRISASGSRRLERVPFAVSADSTQLQLDLPYGLFVTDSAVQAFHLAKSVGCLCPPGFAIARIGSEHCQPAPMGGYVNVLGVFQACGPGTFASLNQATSEATCQPCPPRTVSQRSQSSQCERCVEGLPDPSHTTCVQRCPPGTVLAAAGDCAACPAGQTRLGDGRCAECPLMTYTDPDAQIYECTACNGSLSGACPQPCNNSSLIITVATVTMLGFRPVDLAVAQNGTVYIAAFQLLVTVDQSGGSQLIPMAEFGLVRGLALQPQEERVLYAAVSQDSLMCLVFVGVRHLQRMWYMRTSVPVVVGVRGSARQGWLALWDAATNSAWVQGAVVLRGDASNAIVAMCVWEERVVLMLQHVQLGNQSVVLQGGQVWASADRRTAWNPFMVVWRGQIVLSSANALLGLAGVGNQTGCVDHVGSQARFTGPGPMAVAPDPSMLLVGDQVGLRLLYAGQACACPENHRQVEAGCLRCPAGLVSMGGSRTCTVCTQGQYNDERTGSCTPCARIRWWAAAPQPCPPLVDTMVASDASGLSLEDVFSELMRPPQGIMRTKDYVSLQTLLLPLAHDSVLQDAAARSRFWTRAERVTPPPEVYVGDQLLDLQLELLLPGFWIECSLYVLQFEACTCDLPAGGLTLGNNDSAALWNKARADAAAMDYSSVLITIPPDPDLYMHGAGEAVHFMNVTVSPTALFVSRTDAGGGTDDDNPNVLYLPSVDEAMSLPVPPLPSPTPSQSSFAACVAGWPATYGCPAGYLWAAPLYTCVPCRPGFYYVEGRCVGCPLGSYSPAPGATACLECLMARAVGLSYCSAPPPSAPAAAPCPLGQERRVGSDDTCMPCVPGFAGRCAPCAPGQYANAPGRTACSSCPFPLVATQWGSTTCVECNRGYVPSPKGDACQLCRAGAQYFVERRGLGPQCVNKTVVRCGRGQYLQDGGPYMDNRCVACDGCADGQLMVPFLARPCDYAETRALGPPYRCVPLESVQGQFSRLSVHPQNASGLYVQYTPCQGLPPYATWAVGPHPAFCYFQCSYAISAPVRQQYLFFYSMAQPDAETLAMLLALLRSAVNVFPLDYPGLGVGLMLMARALCLPCPNTQCGWGLWRPMADGCGPPVCQPNECQLMGAGELAYAKDGCVMNCTYPSHAHLTGLAPLGMGDSCPWECNFGFYRQQIIKDLDTNETGFVCLPCAPSACQEGKEEYQAVLCRPQATTADFCLPCPSSALAQLVPGSGPGQCKYACLPNVSYLSDHQCKPCASSLMCPAGFRRACAEIPCTACPPMPKNLWSSAVTMPSNSSVCQAACREGYHTLDAITRQVLLPPALSYDPTTIVCAPCSLRPQLQCPMRTCPAGFFMPVPGSGLCSACPTPIECGEGLFPSACLCAQCPPPPEGRIAVVTGEVCPTACAPNRMMVGGVCVPCSSFNTPQLSFFALWNASNGSRWWPPALDPPHLRPSSPGGTPERRAGVCWPCPPGTVTLPGDPDLCLSFALVPVPQRLPGGAAARALGLPPTGRLWPKRSLLVSEERQLRLLCPAFASGQLCKCNPGFERSADGRCQFAKTCLAHMRLEVAPHAVLVLQQPPLPRSTARHMMPAAEGCPPGTQWKQGACETCPKGTYSRHAGFGPCLGCPSNMTTTHAGSLSRAQCLVHRERDMAFPALLWWQRGYKKNG